MIKQSINYFISTFSFHYSDHGMLHSRTANDKSTTAMFLNTAGRLSAKIMPTLDPFEPECGMDGNPNRVR